MNNQGTTDQKLVVFPQKTKPKILVSTPPIGDHPIGDHLSSVSQYQRLHANQVSVYAKPFLVVLLSERRYGSVCTASIDRRRASLHTASTSLHLWRHNLRDALCNASVRSELPICLFAEPSLKWMKCRLISFMSVRNKGERENGAEETTLATLALFVNECFRIIESVIKWRSR